MSRIRVEIDLNVIDDFGLTRARIQDANGDLERGQIVTAFEPEAEVRAVAFVERVDSESGYIMLRVNWESLEDDALLEVGPRFVASNIFATNVGGRWTKTRSRHEGSSVNIGAAVLVSQ